MSGLLSPNPATRWIPPLSLSRSLQQQQNKETAARRFFPSLGGSATTASATSSSAWTSQRLMQSPFFAGFDWMGLRAGRHVAPFIPPTAALVGTVPLTFDEHMQLRTSTYTAQETAKSTAKEKKNHANYLASTKASRLGKAGAQFSIKNMPTNDTEVVPEPEPTPPNPIIYHGKQSMFENF